jgi:transketolase
LNGIAFDTYVLLGDGECAEGSVWEAAEIASYYKTDNLFAIVDVNGLGQSQHTMDRFDVVRFADKFRAFGWYAVTVDGHNYVDILEAFERCKRDAGTQPRAIIAKTFKGHGVSFIENKDGWHGKAVPRHDLDKALQELSQPFGPDDWKPNPPPKPAAMPPAPAGPVGIAVNRKIGDSVATREAYGDALVRLGTADSRIIALDGDTKNSTFTEKLQKARPNQFLEMFIAEQNMVGVATGLAARGKIPFVSTFAAFLTRAFDQIRMAGISRSNVKFCGSHCGVSIGEDGPSQMGLEDIAMFRAVAESVILYPADAVATERVVALAAQHKGIVYIRTTRPKTPVIYKNEEPFEIGGSKVVRQSDSDRATIIGAGITLYEALKAAAALESDGILVRVIDAYSVKPIDEAALQAAAAATGGRMVVVEDHYAGGGLGDAVLNAVTGRARVVKLAVREIPRSGPPEALIDKYGIGSKQIIAAVKSLL